MGESLAIEWRSFSVMERWVVVLTLAATMLSVVYAIFDYPVIGHDSFLHLHWLTQFTQLREQGVNYPRWLPDGFHGLGSPAFYFYPPLGYFVASAMHSVAGGSAEQMYHSVQLLSGLLGALILYSVLRRRGMKRLAAITAALAFSFAAYRYVDVYIRNAFGEHIALAILPLLVIEWHDRLRNIASISLAVALLILSSVPVTVLGGFLLLMRAIARPKSIVDMILGGIIAGAATAIYWYPTLALSQYIQVSHLHDAVVQSSIYTDALPNMFGGGFDRLHLVMVATYSAGIVLTIERMRTHRWDAHTWCLLLIVVLQIPYVTDHLWHSVPPFSYLQFSWRLNALIWLFVVYEAMRDRRVASALMLLLLGVSLTISVTQLPILLRHTQIPDDPIRYDAPEHATIWAPNDVWDFYHLAMRHRSDPDMDVAHGIVHTLERSAEESLYAVELADSELVQLHLMYWPYWSAHINGKSVPLTERQGIAQLQLGAGYSDVTLELVRSPAEKTGSTMSIVGAAFLVVVLGAASYTEFRSRIRT